MIRLIDIGNLEDFAILYHLILHEIMIEYPKQFAEGIAKAEDANAREQFETFMHGIIDKYSANGSERVKQLKERRLETIRLRKYAICMI